MSLPKVSIITLTWNSEKTIRQTAKSVLDQEYAHFEHIIIDNLSQDRTIEIVNELYQDQLDKVIILSEKDHGISDGFNKGIKAATGDIITFLNSDDSYIDNNILPTVIEAFQDEEVMYVHGDMIFEDEIYGTNRRKALLCSLEEAMPYNHPTLFVRSQLYDKHGFFNLEYKYTMDFEFICRLYDKPNLPKYKSVYIKSTPFVLMKAGGVSWEYEQESLQELAKALKKYSFYTEKAKSFLQRRSTRIRFRKLLSKLHLNFIVKLWRAYKWRSFSKNE